MNLNLPELTEVLGEIEFFERVRTDRHLAELAIPLCDYGVNLCKVFRVFSWISVTQSYSEGIC